MDYLLRYRRDFPIAVVEAKAIHRLPGDGLQQAKEYAQILGLSFAYSSNGEAIIEFDFTTGREQQIGAFPTPDELWSRLRASEHLTDDASANRTPEPPNRATENPRSPDAGLEAT